MTATCNLQETKNPSVFTNKLFYKNELHMHGRKQDYQINGSLVHSVPKIAYFSKEKRRCEWVGVNCVSVGVLLVTPRVYANPRDNYRETEPRDYEPEPRPSDEITNQSHVSDTRVVSRPTWRTWIIHPSRESYVWTWFCAERRNFLWSWF